MSELASSSEIVLDLAADGRCESVGPRNTHATFPIFNDAEIYEQDLPDSLRRAVDKLGLLMK